MPSRTACDCGTTLAEALGACGCQHCGGSGCPRCSVEPEAFTSCFWCGQPSVNPELAEAAQPWRPLLR
jgi:hypothetical protein